MTTSCAARRNEVRERWPMRCCERVLVCVILTHMRTATIREAQHNLPSILRSVSRGEVIEITRRNRVVARLVPAAPRPVGGLPDFVARARAMWGRRPHGKPTSEIVIEARAERR